MRHILAYRLKAPVEGLHNVYREVTNEDYSSRLNYVRPTSLAHRNRSLPYARKLIFGKLDYKKRLFLLISRQLVYEQRAEEDYGNTRKIH